MALNVLLQSVTKYLEASYHPPPTETLHDILYDPVTIESLSSSSFSATLLTLCCFNLPSLSPDDIALSPILPTSTYPTATSSAQIFRRVAQIYPDLEQYSYDNNHNVLYHATVSDSRTTKFSLSSLNVLFSLPYMDEVLPREVQLKLTQRGGVEVVLLQWLKDLHTQNLRYLALLHPQERETQRGTKRDTQRDRQRDNGYSGFTAQDLLSLSLPIMLPPQISLILREKLLLVSRLLQSNTSDKRNGSTALNPSTVSSSSLSHDHVLGTFFPELAPVYREARLSSVFVRSHLDRGSSDDEKDIDEDEEIDRQKQKEREEEEERDREKSGVEGLTSYALVYHKVTEKAKLYGRRQER